MELRKVDSENIWKIVKLSVFDEQKGFVATNTESILEAYVTITAGGTALPFGIYDDDILVGFIMFGYGTVGDEDEPMHVALNYLKTYPCGAADSVWLSYEPENIAARTLYSAMGFIENGEMCGDEIVAVRKL